MKSVIVIVLISVCFFKVCMINNTSNSNLYLIYSGSDIIRSNYHNSRDLSNGWVRYYDATTGKEETISFNSIDSIEVLAENFWISGPKSKEIKYINKITGR